MSVMAQATVWVWRRALTQCLGVLTKGGTLCGTQDPACSERGGKDPEMLRPPLWSVKEDEAGDAVVGGCSFVPGRPDPK